MVVQSALRGVAPSPAHVSQLLRPARSRLVRVARTPAAVAARSNLQLLLLHVIHRIPVELSYGVAVEVSRPQNRGD